MLYMIAAGTKIDTSKSERFSKQIEAVYKNPFVIVRPQPRTAGEIMDYIYKRVEEAKAWT